MSLRPSSRAEQRRKSSKKTIDADEARKKREEVSIEIRKSKREENLQKRRQFRQAMNSGGSEGGQGGQDIAHGAGGFGQDMSSSTGGGANSNQANASTIKEKLELLPQMVQGVFTEVSEHQLSAVLPFVCNC